ncbi:hypothetical protein F8M41_026250 [Gigaspora margarita]|uniref:Uncharacterized protein n=1 Tax=Gigaspora margarita TaxID=4874 RepID=A0A8H4AZY4_GIGMA|nr:hypothetical protein F8M41_026250 [Gigaspora margarita]
MAWPQHTRNYCNIRNSFKTLKYFDYKKASNQHLMEEQLQYLNFLEDHFKETRDSKRVLKNQEGLFQCISEEKKKQSKIWKKKEILFLLECSTLDYRVEEILKQAKNPKENHIKLPKPLVQSKTLAMIIDNRLNESDQDMAKSFHSLNNKRKAKN